MPEVPGSTRFDPVPLSPELQSRFVQENMRRVFLLIYRIVGNVSDAQDLTQEAFIKALQRQDQLKDLDKAAHWLSRIASNTAIDFLRRSGRVSFPNSMRCLNRWRFRRWRIRSRWCSEPSVASTWNRGWIF